MDMLPSFTRWRKTAHIKKGKQQMLRHGFGAGREVLYGLGLPVMVYGCDMWLWEQKPPKPEQMDS